jgi:hypothetical protein
MISREAGRQSEESAEHSEKAKSSICSSWESGANVTTERLTHRRRQFVERSSIEEGMQIEKSVEHGGKWNEPGHETRGKGSKFWH